ncbi:MAG: hypothetical protein IJ608_00500 [Lachnospiraceae bacterium]|nr:hypothetical protein [Lachnospiraceae bacterium]
MRYDFLKNFPRRMKNVGLYAILLKNTISKNTWNEYGFTGDIEQINLVFSILLFIMEKSLKEEDCTIDMIAVFLDDINDEYYNKSLSYDECLKLSDYIINVVLSNEGRQMSFDGYDYEQDAYHIFYIRYITNRIVYDENGVKRTSYRLTDDGYNLLLSTLEVESNMRITIREMIFRLHLEKQNYDKAVDDIKNIFHDMRIQYQKNTEAMQRIRKNALDYSVDEYKQLLEGNIDTITDTKRKFEGYREWVNTRINEFEERDLDVTGLSEDEENKLMDLRVIVDYLDRTIDEHQKILSGHMNLKDLYTKELNNLAELKLIKRFSIKSEVYDRIIDNPEALKELNILFAPLLLNNVDKVYNLQKALKPHRVSRKKSDEETTDDIDFDEKSWEEEQRRLREEKRKLYRGSLGMILNMAIERGEITLKDIKDEAGALEDGLNTLIPGVDVFKEIMVELIRGQRIDIEELKKERSEAFELENEIFVLNYMLLELLEKYDKKGRIKILEIERIYNEPQIVFEKIKCSDGTVKNIRCSNVRIRAVGQVE